MRFFIILCIFFGFIYALDDKVEDSFGARFSVGSGAMAYKSNIFARGDLYYRGHANTHIRYIPMASINLNYSPYSYLKTYFKSLGSRDINGLALGGELKYSGFKSNIAFLQSLFDKEFSNLYDIDTSRNTTSVNKSGILLNQTYEFSKMLSLSAEYIYISKHLREDLTQDKRDAALHKIELGSKIYGQSLKIGFYQNDAKSKSSSYVGYRFTFAPFIPLGKSLILGAAFSYGDFKYLEKNSFFSIKRSDTQRDLGIFMIKRNFLDKENLSFHISLLHRDTKSNISFYNETFNIALLNLGIMI